MHNPLVIAVCAAALLLPSACKRRSIEGNFYCEAMPQSTMELRADGTWEDNAGARGTYTLQDGLLDLRITNRVGANGRKEPYMSFFKRGGVLTEFRLPSSLYASPGPRWLRKSKVRK